MTKYRSCAKAKVVMTFITQRAYDKCHSNHTEVLPTAVTIASCHSCNDVPSYSTSNTPLVYDGIFLYHWLMIAHAMVTTYK